MGWDGMGYRVSISILVDERGVIADPIVRSN